MWPATPSSLRLPLVGIHPIKHLVTGAPTPRTEIRLGARTREFLPLVKKGRPFGLDRAASGRNGLASRLSRHGVEGVCGPLVGGAFLAELIAAELDLEFSYAERLAMPEIVDYRVPSALRSSVRGRRLAIVDNVIYAGSAVLKTLTDLRQCGAEPTAIGALLVLGSTAQRLAADEALPLERRASLTSGLWSPEACPLCAAQVPLDDPTAGAGATG